VRRKVIDPGQVGLLWMDIQGHEGHALAGARMLVTRGVPVVFEFSPEHLQLAGGTDLLLDTVAEHYTHVVDLAGMRRGEQPDFVPAAKARELLSGYVTTFTDVLAIRLPPGSSA
jgi:hypothetical protein